MLSLAIDRELFMMAFGRDVDYHDTVPRLQRYCQGAATSCPPCSEDDLESEREAVACARAFAEAARIAHEAARATAELRA